MKTKEMVRAAYNLNRWESIRLTTLSVLALFGSMREIWRLILAIVISLVASEIAASPSLAATGGCKAINKLPVVIQTSGTYCLSRNLSSAFQAGVLINILSDDVTIDLNGFTIDGSPGGSNTETTVIYGSSVNNITVKNGTIKGFSTAISLYGTDSQNNVIENIKALSNSLAGIVMEGNGVTIRNNNIQGTGGASNSGYGIVLQGASGHVLGNDIGELWPGSGANTNAIYIYNSKGIVVEQNRISSRINALYGIRIFSSTDVLVINNRIAGVTNGIHYQSSSGKFRDNLTSSVTSPFIGGANAGNNN